MIWGGYHFGTEGTVHGDGAAYDPETDQWRPLPDAPLTPRCHTSAAWTGSAFIVWGGVERCGSPGPGTNDGVVFYP